MPENPYLTNLAKTLLGEVSLRMEMSPSNGNLRRNKLAGIAAVASALERVGYCAYAASCDAKVGNAFISHVAALRVEAEDGEAILMDLEGNVGWDAIEAKTIAQSSMPKKRDPYPVYEFKRYTLEHVSQSLWPKETKELESWANEFAIQIQSDWLSKETPQVSARSNTPRL